MALTQDEHYLFTAIRKGNIQQIMILVAKHIQTGQRRIEKDIHSILDEEGLSPLHVAAMQDSPEPLRALLNYYPDFDRNHRGGRNLYTPLHLAAFNGKTATLGLLLCAHVDMNGLDGSGNTPLFWAIQANRADVVNTLLSIKAELNIRNAAGQTVLDLAIATQNLSLIESLLEYGFDIDRMYDDAGKATLLQSTNAHIKGVLQEYIALHFVDYSLDARFAHLEAQTAQQLVELQTIILANQAKILDPKTVRLLEHLQRWIEIKTYPNLCPDYAIKYGLNSKIINDFRVSEGHYYLYVPGMRQNNIDHHAYLTPIPTGQKPADIINTLITSLLYESHHYRPEDPCCIFRRRVIEWINARYVNFTIMDHYEQQMTRRETRAGTFFGEDISDDSDDELLTQPYPLENPDYSHRMIHRAGISFFKTEMTNVLRQTQKIDESKAKDRADTILKGKKQGRARSTLPYHRLDEYSIPGTSPYLDRAKADLIILNRYLKNGMAIEKAVLKVQTQFVVAQYRGISYDLGWNARSRRAHRRADERYYPYYSHSVYSAAQFNLAREYSPEKHFSVAMQSLLKIVGEKSQAMLLSMHQTPEARTAKYTFDNFAEYIQDQYSKNYKKFHAALGPGGGLSTYQGTYFLNDKNPFVSTSDRPDHAVRYALTKPYAGNEARRLRPRWRKDGRAERPYSGKAYISLHPLTDYQPNSPMHLTSLVRKGKSNVFNNILAERETTFPATIPAGRLVYHCDIRYPSFKNPYHPKYMEKYGLDKELYDMFAHAIKTYPPHSHENRYVKKILSNWLAAYREVRLIDTAFYEAMKLGRVLLYQSDDGGFSMELPPNGFRKGPNYTEIQLVRQNRTQ